MSRRSWRSIGAFVVVFTSRDEDPAKRKGSGDSDGKRKSCRPKASNKTKLTKNFNNKRIKKLTLDFFAKVCYNGI